MILYHVTTPKKAKLYKEQGKIISPVKGWLTTMIRKTIFLDMDGVVADFTGFVTTYHKTDICNLTPKQLWEPFQEKVPNIFLQLSLIDGAKEFFDTVVEIANSNQYEVRFLSALPYPTGHLITSAQDKILWVNKHLSSTHEVHTVMGGGSNKKYYVNSSKDILIDDREKNCLAFKKYGGKIILHKNFEETLLLLTTILPLLEN